MLAAYRASCRLHVFTGHRPIAGEVDRYTEQDISLEVRGSHGAVNDVDADGIGSYPIDLHPSTGGDGSIDISKCPFRDFAPCIGSTAHRQLYPGSQEYWVHVHSQWLLPSAPGGVEYRRIPWRAGRRVGRRGLHAGAGDGRPVAICRLRPTPGSSRCEDALAFPRRLLSCR